MVSILARIGRHTRTAPSGSTSRSLPSSGPSMWQAQTIGLEAKCSIALLRSIQLGELQSADIECVGHYPSMLTLLETDMGA